MSVNIYRSAVERLTKDKADLERKLGSENNKIARLQADISSLEQRALRTNSLSIIQSCQRQIVSKRNDLARAQKSAAAITKRIADKLSDLNRNMQSLERAEGQQRSKQASEAKKRRNDELRHAREITRETERQVRLHSEISSSPLVIDVARLPTKIKVLFVAASPEDQLPLRLDEEMRSIAKTLRAAEYRDSIEVVSAWAVRPGDLLQALNEHQPDIVHFSMHGTEAGELVFQQEDGTTKLVRKDAIVTTISTVSDHVHAVVFNACTSTEQAVAIVEHVDVAIGMSTDVGDEAARVFAAQFYSTIGFGLSIGQAFRQACAALMMADIPEETTPQLFAREGIDPDELFLVRT